MSKVSGAEGFKCAVHWFSGSDEVCGDNTLKRLFHEDIQEMELKTKHQAMCDQFKALVGRGRE